jgi:predicted tellurium resistance membrane protein TerC
MELLAQPDAWLAFATLTVLELVLGIDNIIFIAILVDKLPAERQELTRRLGLVLAMGMRIVLLFLITWIVGLTACFSCSRARRRWTSSSRAGPATRRRR